jgi:hypothetical protein
MIMQEPGSQQQPQTPPPYSAFDPVPPAQGSYSAATGAPIPAPTGDPLYVAAAYTGANDSGTGPTAVLPAELQGFNWGACLLTWIWSIGMQFWLGLISLPVGLAVGSIPFIGFFLNIGIMVFFGMKGNEWAWQNRKWDSAEQFRATQRVWAIWGVCLFVVIVLLTVIAFALLGAAILQGARNMPQTNPAFQTVPR